MEAVYGILIIALLMALWAASGWVVVKVVDFLSMYFKGENMFESVQPFHPAVGLGPLMFVWMFYPLWIVVKKGWEYVYGRVGCKVVVEDIRKYHSDYKYRCIDRASTKTLVNFFKTYLEKTESKFYSSQEGDRNALENFFRIDGWRNVKDGVWTKIVKVKDLNTGEG